MYAKKAGKTLNISTEEGAIVIKRIEKEIPKTIAFVKSVSDFATKNGYVIHNTRTNSRRWFPFLIRQLKGEITMDTNFLDISGEASSARNSSIQGTQADFVKEASVKLQYYYWKNKIDADIILWVHDEIADRMEESIAEETSKIKHKIMVDVANKYLHNVTIECEMHLLPYWTK